MNRGSLSLKDLQLRHMKKMEAIAARRAQGLPSTTTTTTTSNESSKPKPVISPLVLTQQHKIILCLQKERRSFSIDEIMAQTGINLHEPKHKSLFQSLILNERVVFDSVGGLFSYQPAHAVKNEDELVDLVNHYPDGLDGEELRDSYTKIAEDISNAIKTRRILAIKIRSEPFLPILFPNNTPLNSNSNSNSTISTSYSVTTFNVTQEIKDLWNSVALPEDFEIAKKLKELGNFESQPTQSTSHSSSASTQKGKRRRKQKS